MRVQRDEMMMEQGDCDVKKRKMITDCHVMTVRDTVHVPVRSPMLPYGGPA